MENYYILSVINKFKVDNPNIDFTVRIGKGLVICEVKN